MGLYTELGLRRVRKEKGVSNFGDFCDLQPRQPQAALNFDIVVRMNQVPWHLPFCPLLSGQCLHSIG